MAWTPFTKVNRDDLRPGQRLNVVDRVVSFFNPGAGVNRMIDRSKLHAFGYNDTPERRGKAPPLSSGESWVKNRDRLKQMADARDLVTYDWIGGIIARLTLYVCGKIHCKSATGDPEIDQAYDEFFHGWCGDMPNDDGSIRCDYTGRHRLLKKVQMAFMGFLVDGDHGFVEVEPLLDNEGNLLLDEQGIPVQEFSLQNISADRIGPGPNDSSMSDFKIGGVNIDPLTGRVSHYDIYRLTRSGQWTDKQEVPASGFIHVMDADLCDEYRGRTKLVRLLNDTRDIREAIESEKMAMKTQSQFAGVGSTKDPTNNQGALAWKDKNDAGTPTQDAIWGKLLKLAEGENFSLIAPPSRPSGGFVSLVQMLIRKMAISLNLPYGFIWDLSTLGGVNSRIEIQGAHRQIEYWQNNIIVSQILNRVRNKVIAQGVSLKLLPPHPNWRKCEWHFGPWITTDAGYEMEADIAGIQAGILPISDVVGKYGFSPLEVFKGNASVANEALMVGAETELMAETFAGGLYPNITEQKAAFLQPTPLPEPPPMSIEAIGDKGLKILIEIMEKVGDGTFDRESAINAVMQAFPGTTKAQAEKVIPDEPSTADLNRAAGLTPSGKPGQVVAGGAKGGAKKPASKSAAKKPAAKKPAPKKKK